MKHAVLYRVEGRRWASLLNEYDEPTGPGRLTIETHEHRVLAYTTCGAWIDDYGAKKFVNLRAVKQFACASLDEARAAFAARKRRQIAILSANLRDARTLAPYGPIVRNYLLTNPSVLITINP